MSQFLKIHDDKGNSRFILTGDTLSALNNKRLLFSLKRLTFTRDKDGLCIPYKKVSQIVTLQEIQELIKKFGFTEELSHETKKDIESFSREEETFKEFSGKAKDIRNNRFEDNKELLHEFDSFQKVIKKNLIRKLYPLQLLSAYHMAFAQNACNFSVPGAGKTSIVYGAYTYLRGLSEDNPKHVDKILVIGPLSSFAPWENEYIECFGKKPDVKRLSGDNNISRTDKEQHLFSGNPAEVTLIFHGGVESLQEEIIDFLKRNKTMVVVDEAHRIKNPTGVWGKSVVEIAKEAKSRIVLTGTPAPNGYEDLFNLYQYLYPYKYKDILKFHYGNLVDMTQHSHEDSDRVREFINNINPYFIRIKKNDLKLPPIKEKIITIEMDIHQRGIYDFIETKYIKSFKENNSATIKDILNRAKLIRLRQAATNPALLQKPIQETLDEEDFESRIFMGGQMPEEFQNDSEILSKIYNYSKLETPKKFIEIKKLLEERNVSKNKFIIWSVFIQNAKELQKYLSKYDIKSKLLIGEVEQLEREVTIGKFNNPKNKDFQVIIANPFSVAESISLHRGCHNAIYMERDYNCSNFLQSKDRIHRVGLASNQVTNYYYILSKDSIDEVIDNRLSMKVRRMEKIIDEEIPLFARLDDADETDLIKALIENYAKRT